MLSSTTRSCIADSETPHNRSHRQGGDSGQVATQRTCWIGPMPRSSGSCSTGSARLPGTGEPVGGGRRGPVSGHGGGILSDPGPAARRGRPAAGAERADRRVSNRRVRTVSTAALGADWDAPAESSAVGVTESEAYTAGAAAENLLSRSGSPGRVAARGLAWDAVAEVTGAPVVVPTVLDPSRSREALRIVDAAGRLAAASRRWSRDPDDPAVAALFTPSGRLDMDEQRAVIRTFQPRPPAARRGTPVHIDPHLQSFR